MQMAGDPSAIFLFVTGCRRRSIARPKKPMNEVFRFTPAKPIRCVRPAMFFGRRINLYAWRITLMRDGGLVCARPERHLVAGGQATRRLKGTKRVHNDDSSRHRSDQRNRPCDGRQTSAVGRPRHCRRPQCGARRKDGCRNPCSRRESRFHLVRSSRCGERGAVARRAIELGGGQVDILVNNVGIFPFGPTHEMSEKSFDEVYAVNVKASLLPNWPR